MKRLAPKFILVGIWVALLILAGIPIGAQGIAAAPMAVVTGTEQPTRTPTTGPANTPTSPTGPTNTPKTNNKSENGVADPYVTKAVNVTEARVGDEVTFTITVGNRGNVAASDVVVTDPFPEYLDVIEATTTRGNITSSGRTVTVTIGRVEETDTITIRIRTRVNSLARPPEGRNIVTLTTSNSSDNPGNNTSEVTFKIIGEATPTAGPESVPNTPVPASPVRPAQLPRTGADETGATMLLVALGGLLALGLSLLIRRAVRR